MFLALDPREHDIDEVSLGARRKEQSQHPFQDPAGATGHSSLVDHRVRVAEACDLTVEGVDLDDGMALVRARAPRSAGPHGYADRPLPRPLSTRPRCMPRRSDCFGPSGYLLVTCARHAAEGQDRRRVASDCSRT